MRTAILFIACLCVSLASFATHADEDPTARLLLDYQAAEAFRDRLRPSMLRVRVEAAVLPGCDPDFRPVVFGSAAVVRLPGVEAPLVLTAAPLVRGAHRVTLVAAPDRESDARVERMLDEPGVAVLVPEHTAALGPLRPLAADVTAEALDPGRPVFTLDNLASGLEILLKGEVVEVGEPPLVDLRVVSLEAGAGEPLVDVRGQFVGLCFRRVTALDRRCFASRAHDIARAWRGEGPAAGDADPVTPVP